MKFNRIPILVYLLLLVAAILLLNFLPRPLLLFTLFNGVVLAIIVGSYRPPAEEVNMTLPCLYEGEENAHDRDEGDDRQEAGDECGDCGYGSDGYDEDDDDNGSDDEVGWQDEEEAEYDENLETRIEDFIQKVNKGWTEERLKEKSLQ